MAPGSSLRSHCPLCGAKYTFGEHACLVDGATLLPEDSYISIAPPSRLPPLPLLVVGSALAMVLAVSLGFAVGWRATEEPVVPVPTAPAALTAVPDAPLRTRVETVPPGATVRRYGAVLCVTPCVLDGPRAVGPVFLELAGHQVANTSLVAGRTYRVALAVEATEPAAATVPSGIPARRAASPPPPRAPAPTGKPSTRSPAAAPGAGSSDLRNPFD